jgi:hypothetical protein
MLYMSARPDRRGGPAGRQNRGDSMEWDLGIAGAGLLLAMALAFGVAAQVVLWRATTHWMWAIGAFAYFVSGIVVSEVWFGWATEEDLQPNIDGLSFDEVLLIGTLMALAAVIAAWQLERRIHRIAPG